MTSSPRAPSRRRSPPVASLALSARAVPESRAPSDAMELVISAPASERAPTVSVLAWPGPPRSRSQQGSPGRRAAAAVARTASSAPRSYERPSASGTRRAPRRGCMEPPGAVGAGNRRARCPPSRPRGKWPGFDSACRRDRSQKGRASPTIGDPVGDICAFLSQAEIAGIEPPDLDPVGHARIEDTDGVLRAGGIRSAREHGSLHAARAKLFGVRVGPLARAARVGGCRYASSEALVGHFLALDNQKPEPYEPVISGPVASILLREEPIGPVQEWPHRVEVHGTGIMGRRVGSVAADPHPAAAPAGAEPARFHAVHEFAVVVGYGSPLEKPPNPSSEVLPLDLKLDVPDFVASRL